MRVLFDAHTRKEDLPALIKLYPGRANVFLHDTPYNHLFPGDEDIRTHALTTSRLLLHGEDILPGTIERLADVIVAVNRKNDVFQGSGKFAVWSEVHECLAAMKPFDNMSRYFKTVLCTRTRALMDAFGPILNFRKGLDLRDTEDANNIVVQDPRLPPNIRRFHVLDHLTRRLNHRRRLSFGEIAELPLRLCIIDDSAEIFDARLEKKGDFPPIFELVTMARQYRIGFVCVTQIPELLGRSIWDNHGTTISFRLPSLESRKKVAEVLG